MEESSPPIDEQEAHAAERVGWLLRDRWELKELLGVGGMAAVYRAVHKNGRETAIKILHPQLAQNVEATERFLEEGYASNAVGHPGTVAVLDDGTAPDGAAYLVMELLEGETLEARLLRGRLTLPPLDVLALMGPLLEILGAAHERGIIHRDIKPENVFLTRKGEVKLLDFGIARMTESRRATRTQAGTTMGTPAYMSPEQARGRWEELDARSDLWSVGATMFVLLSGRTVHAADTMNELLLAAMTELPPPIQDVAPGIPDEVARLVDRALDPDPVRRFQSAGEMRCAIVRAQRALEADHLERGYSQPPPIAGGPIEPSFDLSLKTTHRPVTSTQSPAAVRQVTSRWLWGLASAAVVAAGVSLIVFRGGEDATGAPHVSDHAGRSTHQERTSPGVDASSDPAADTPLVDATEEHSPRDTHPAGPAPQKDPVLAERSPTSRNAVSKGAVQGSDAPSPASPPAGALSPAGPPDALSDPASAAEPASSAASSPAPPPTPPPNDGAAFDPLSRRR